MEKIATDISSFENLRKDGFVYVDKTDLLWRLASLKEGRQFFISRPRRFGKSLMLSTLKCLFEGRRDLFKGLKIERKRWDWKRTWPVVMLNMADVVGANAGEVHENLLDMVDGLVESFGLKNVRRVSAPGKYLGNFFKALAAAKGEFVVLVDEYDVPLQGFLGERASLLRVRKLMHDFYIQLKNNVAACVFDISKGPIDANMWRVSKKVREVATVKTKIGETLTKDELVFSVDCMEPEMDNVSCPYETSGADNLWYNNGVEIYLNPSADRKRIVHFVLSSNGAFSMGYEDKKSGKPEAWSLPEGVKWTARRTVPGWAGELRVPRTLLKDMASSFPANFCRWRALKGKAAEMIMWNRYTFLFGDLEHFGTMVVE